MEPVVASAPKPPRGLLRWLVRLPIGLYRLRLGWLLGNRFLMLTHIGRKSGLPRDTVLEVVRSDRASGVYIVVAGFGEKSDWFRNIGRTPEVIVHASGRKLTATASRLPPEAAVSEFKDYARRHPAALKMLARILGYPWDGTQASYEKLAALLPVVALQARSAPQRPDS